LVYRPYHYGIVFWGLERDGQLVGVMGIQDKGDVTLIRHAYVLSREQKSGIGKKLLQYLQSMTEKPILIGAWAAASWAVSFYLRDLHFTPPLFGINCYLNLAGRFG